MSNKKMNVLQVTDADGHPILNCNHPVDVLVNDTTVLLTGVGVLLGFTIGTEVEGGTYYCTNTAGTAIAGLPSSTRKWSLDNPGSVPIPRVEITAGLKIITADSTGLVMSAWCFQV
jgi:hypothetical protein